MNIKEPKITVLAPLNDFNWDGDEFQIKGFGSIIDFETVNLDLKLIDDIFDRSKLELQSVKHCLCFKSSESEMLSPGEMVTLFLVALWITIPTRTHVKFRFEDPIMDESISYSPVSQMMEYFQWIDGYVKSDVRTSDLEEVSNYIKPLKDIWSAQKRLWHALSLTAAGCMAYRWQVAAICFSSAAEAIMTYNTRSGITKRLAKTYACLIRKSKSDRDRAYQEFLHLYSVRSDIIHGRIHELEDGDNLSRLYFLSNMLRSLWSAILHSDSTILDLEQNDIKRGLFFNKLTYGYSPPTI